MDNARSSLRGTLKRFRCHPGSGKAASLLAALPDGTFQLLCEIPLLGHLKRLVDAEYARRALRGAGNA